MSYKFATGSVFRGDIYAEDDAQGNTYIDWSPHGDAVGIITGGTATLIVSASSVGVGTTSPASVFDVSGSQAGNLFTTEADLTLGDAHFMVAFGGSTARTGSLPETSTCPGRIYHIFNSQHEAANPVEISASLSQTISGESGRLYLMGGEVGNTAVSIVSNGGSGAEGDWMIFGQYSPPEGE